jgi:hypothetical protein
MAVHIEPVRDERAERIIRDPSGYFDQARERARESVEREIARER